MHLVALAAQEHERRLGQRLGVCPFFRKVTIRSDRTVTFDMESYPRCQTRLVFEESRNGWMGSADPSAA